MRYNSFPRRFGSRRQSLTKMCVDMLSEKLKASYSDDDQSFSWAELYSVAKGIEWSYRFAGAVANNAIPAKATFALEDWEKLYGIPPNNSLSQSERRRNLAARTMNASNTMEYIEGICKKIFGASFLSLSTDDGYAYWEGNPHQDPGWDWCTTSCRLIIRISTSEFMSYEEYSRRCNRLGEILDLILPIWSDWSISYGTEAFKTDIGKIGYTPMI